MIWASRCTDFIRLTSYAGNVVRTPDGCRRYPHSPFFRFFLRCNPFIFQFYELNITGLSSFFDFSSFSVYSFGWFIFLRSSIKKQGIAAAAYTHHRQYPVEVVLIFFWYIPTHHIGGRIISIYEDIYILQTLQQQSSATNLTQTTPGANHFAPGGLYHIFLINYSFFTCTLSLYQLCASQPQIAYNLHENQGSGDDNRQRRV